MNILKLTFYNNIRYCIQKSIFSLLLCIVFNSSQAQYNQPLVNFSITGGCINDSVSFYPQVLGLDTITVSDSVTQVIWNYGDGVIDTVTVFPAADSVFKTNHVYTTSGIFYPSLRVINRNQIDSIFTKRIVISPRVTVTATNPYYEDFNTGTGGWYQELAEGSTTSTVADSLWEWGIGTGTTINTTASGNKIWGTRTAHLPTTYIEGETGWVYSPCFDLSQLDQPMISLDVWRDMLSGIDGAVLEYYDTGTQTWNTLGDAYNYGINWYQSGFVLSRPGAQANVTFPVGWTGETLQKENARYALDHFNDDLRNKTDVRFRVAFASSSQTIITNNEGFAFDNVYIRNHTKNVLVEHFSDPSYYRIDTIEMGLYDTLNKMPYKDNVHLVQYNIGTYASDSFYLYNTVGNNIRTLFYGVPDANKVSVNGGTLGTTSLLQEELLSQELLKDPQFDIRFGAVPFLHSPSNTLSTTVIVEALEDLPVDMYQVYVVITEDSLVHPVLGHSTRSIFRNFIQSNNAVYAQTWVAGETHISGVNFQYNSSLNPDHLNITAFVQNMTTKEVYQVKSQRLYQSTNLPPNMGAIEGTVALDTNSNCIRDSLEIGLYGQMVEMDNNGYKYTISSNRFGQFYGIVDTGTYTLSIPNLNSYRTRCTLPSVVVGGGETDTVDILVKDSILCPYLVVDIAAPFLRPTGGGSNYTVQYCNHGTIAAMNAFVEVKLDTNLIVQSTTIPYTNPSIGIYRFNLGNLAVEECGSFQISVLAVPTVSIGQTLCAEAHIFPDSICIPNLWSGPIVNTSGTCVGDTIYFSIQNTGATMGGYLPYYVVEDNIMMRIDSFQLGSGQTQNIAVAVLPGRTYRIIAEQESGYPSVLGDAAVTTAIEACSTYTNGTFHTGYVTQFSNGNSAPFIAVDCQEVVGSYDPNDKSAQPKGYENQHYIYNYTDLDYRIRFQNTGTDTAFLVVIRDTISPLLDLTTLTMGASSHNYTWQVKDNRVLEITFDNIMLPDSNVNEPASNGFVRYKIEQNVGNDIGDVIYNTANIYFDFNAPIITNTTYHTIGENYVTVISTQTNTVENSIRVKVYPNPFLENTTIAVEGKTYDELQLSIYDVSGRIILEKQAASNNRIELSRGNLEGGIYIYQLFGDNELISKGKIIAQ